MAKKSNDEDQVDKLSQQIIDKKIQILEISKEIKIFEAQILYLSEHPDLSQDNDEDINIKSFMEDDSDFFTKDDSDLFPETDRAVEKEPNRKKYPRENKSLYGYKKGAENIVFSPFYISIRKPWMIGLFVIQGFFDQYIPFLKRVIISIVRLAFSKSSGISCRSIQSAVASSR